MTDEVALVELAEHEIARLRSMRAENLGNRGTAGPPLDQHPDVTIASASPVFDADGWYKFAKKTPAHPRRVGGVIHPFGLGVHTTDMPPEDWDALVEAWTHKPGDGACCTWLLGRTQAHGLLQLTPLYRNANHVGGDGHGVFTWGGADHHPNLCVAGIELHCAGGVRRVGGVWRFVEDGVVHGAPLPDDEVTPDPQRPGRGWHQVTDYQRATLAALWHHLAPALAPVPAGCVARSLYEPPPSWAVRRGPRLLGHVDLAARDRSDPWPATCEFLRGIVAA